MIKANKQRLFNFLAGMFFVGFLVILLNPSRVRNTFVVDDCLDQGGQWDYKNKICEGINGQVSN
jgi:hypothetical protein